MTCVGISIGALTVKVVALRGKDTIGRVEPHQGRPLEVLARLLAEPGFRGATSFGVSGHLGHISEVAAIARALREVDDRFDAVASLGGESSWESFGLVGRIANRTGLLLVTAAMPGTIADGSCDPHGRSPRVLMLPKPEYRPARLPQSDIGITIARHVSEEFVPPPRGVRLGPRSVCRAAVPKAPVDHHRDLEPRKREIRAAAGARERPVNSEANAECVDG